MDAIPAPAQGEARRGVRRAALADPAILGRATLDAFRKLDPRHLLRNPVIFVTEVVAILVTILAIRAAAIGQPFGFEAGIAAWLWLTVLFATFAEAVAEGRGRAQADSPRRARTEAQAKLPLRPDDRTLFQPRAATELCVGDLVLVEAGDLIPSDGEVAEGIASVNEAAVTGESAPVIRESGGDRSAVTSGTLVVSDWIVVRITAAPGSAFLDRMIALVEGASRQKTPNEIALDILLAGLTIIFLIAVATLVGLASWNGQPPSVPVLAALLVTLIPTTIGGLLSAIGIAGMERLVRFNVLATSGRAVEAAGDVDVLLLDKTGTITLGNRQAAAFSRSPRPPFGGHAGAVQRGPPPIQLPGPVQPLQQDPVQGGPYPGLLPVAQPPPARHARAAAHLGGQRLPRRPGLEHEQDAAGQRRPVRQARASALRLRRPGRQQRLHRRPQVVGNKGARHAARNAPGRVSLDALSHIVDGQHNRGVVRKKFASLLQ